MEIIIVGFHLALIIGIVLLIQALAERRKQRLLEPGKKQTEDAKQRASSTTPVEPISEQKQAVQVVHDGLEHVLNHLSPLASDQPELVLSEIKTKTTADNTNGDGSNGNKESSGGKHCPNCNAAWDDAFDFCLKCSAPATTT